MDNYQKISDLGFEAQCVSDLGNLTDYTRPGKMTLKQSYFKEKNIDGDQFTTKNAAFQSLAQKARYLNCIAAAEAGVPLEEILPPAEAKKVRVMSKEKQMDFVIGRLKNAENRVNEYKRQRKYFS
jgi:pectin methylesterase-like acyl-CoA thioesterase